MPSTHSFHNQNRTIIKKKTVYIYIYIVYILSIKNMILENGAKWNLRKDYEYNIFKK